MGGEELGGSEIVCIRGGAFSRGMTCLCCLGGNCYFAGHVLDNYICRCLERGALSRVDVNIRKQWREFKQEYLRTEQEFQKIRKEREGEAFNVREDRVDRPKEFDFCRRFVNDGKVRCRVIYGDCGRDKCDRCHSGAPFISWNIQLRHVREFFEWVARTTE